MTASYYTLISIFTILLASPFTALAQPSPAEARDPYGYARVTPSMAIIIVVLIAALFFMGFFSVYIRHCANSSNGVSVQGLANGGRSRRAAAARGLDAAVIETFPTLVYSEVKGLKIGKGALECAVCLCEFEDDETLRLLPKCDHVFHPDCIDAWLASHTTCPVCRSNLTPQPVDPPTQTTESLPDSSSDLEAQNEAVVELEPQPEVCENAQVAVAPEPEVMSVNQTLNRNRTRGSRSGRPSKFPRSHSTGHSLIQPGENTDRFTLRLPVEVRKQIMNRELNRTMSMVVFSRERSSKRGYKTGGGEGSSRGKYKRLERLDQGAKSDRLVYNRTPSFLARASSFLTRASSSVRSPRVAASDGEGTSTGPSGPHAVQSNRPPV
ncbi:E3 ubiquitin-protein ligase ATL6 [Ricinus communis]|uniref:RING-type E3 ubiquitin transferase n=1 Tax=Ricinus communis TaxID=3988 RepID=B9RF24_RICCO|nr:E3 ubiquitin-protein ligase ATL6 [Ricinus communis]EEF49795.1 ring finger protein, putative [Ricinus communis]|eukprot:XP_002512343.1 E3 ubiquitin-protein ligase ATL6 [Ricinus communis]